MQIFPAKIVFQRAGGRGRRIGAAQVAAGIAFL
jgi:hypothetical protein